MQNAVSYLAYEELIKQGWFDSQFSELARDLEVLERYGHLEREQRRRLLKLAREVQGRRLGDDIQEPGVSRSASQHSPNQPIH